MCEICIKTKNRKFQPLPHLQHRIFPTTGNVPDYRNFYGISWRGTPHENLAYARQMKYDYGFYQYGMEKTLCRMDCISI